MCTCNLLVQSAHAKESATHALYTDPRIHVKIMKHTLRPQSEANDIKKFSFVLEVCSWLHTLLMHSISSESRVNPQAKTWWNKVPQCCSLYPHLRRSAFRARDLLHRFYKPSSLQPLWHHCCTTHHNPCCPSHLLKVHQPLHGHSHNDRSRKSDDLCFSLCRVCVLGRFTPAPGAHDPSAPAGEARGPLSSLP